MLHHDNKRNLFVTIRGPTFPGAQFSQFGSLLCVTLDMKSDLAVEEVRVSGLSWHHCPTPVN